MRFLSCGIPYWFCILLLITCGNLSFAAGRTAPVSVGNAPVTDASVIRAFQVWQSKNNLSGRSLADRTAFELQGTQFAIARARLMAEWIKSDPKLALVAALSPEAWAQLPPSIRSIVEQPIDAMGDYEVICFTPKQGTPENEQTGIVHQVRFGNTVYPAITYGVGSNARSKFNLRIRGILLDDQFVVDELTFTDQVSTSGTSSSNRGTPISMDAYSATGSKTVLIIAVDFSDLTGDPLDAITLSSGLVNVKQFLEDCSLHQLNLTFTTTPTLRMSKPKADYNTNRVGTYNTLMTEAKALGIANGYNYTSYHHLVILFKDIGYDWGGLGYVGGQGCWVQMYNFNYWQLTMTHELGHNLGLNHAKSLNPTSTTDPLGTGTIIEYGNAFDNMGTSGIPEGIFSGNSQFVLGWLSPTDITTASSTTNSMNTYTITRMDTGSSKIAQRKYSLKIPAAKYFNSNTVDYWVDFRQRFPSRKAAANGVVVQFGNDSGSDGAGVLIDMAPATEELEDAGLEIGRTFSDSSKGISITPVALRDGGPGAEQIDITVARGPFIGNNPPAGAIVIPGSIKVWQPVNLFADASDLNGDALAYFWDLGDNAANLNTASRTHIFTASSSQSIAVTVSDMKGGTASLTANLTLIDPAVAFSQNFSTTYFHPGLRVINGTCFVPFKNSLGYSTDGSNWATQALPASTKGLMHDFASSGSLNVVVGEDYDFNLDQSVGVLMTSPTLSTWTVRSAAVLPPLNAVAYHSGNWVTVGDNGAIARSSNGLIWSACTSGTSVTLNAIVSTDGGFVAVGDSGTVLTSVDGQLWQSLVTGTTASFHAAGPFTSASTILVNGSYRQLVIQWISGGAPQIVQSNSSNYIINDSTYADGISYAVGIRYDSGSSAWKSYLLRSMDGATWDEALLNLTGDVQSIGFNQGRVFYGAVNISNGAGAIYTSSAIYNSQEAWSAASFPGAERFNLNISGPDADPDGDGIPNLMEFALGMNPNSATMNNLPESGSITLNQGQPNEQKYGTLTYLRRVDFVSLGLQYIPEVSYDLATWQGGASAIVELSSTYHGGGQETVVVRTVEPLSDSLPLYLRLRVVQ